MTSADARAFVSVHDNKIQVRFSGVESKVTGQSIDLDDVVRIALENVPIGDQPWCLHWFLQHRAGWTLHFNSDFGGALEVAQQLESSLGFAVPALDAIAGPGGLGTVVWSVSQNG